MSGVALTLFLAAAFVGGVTSGVAGFAMGLVVSGVWLHLITPAETATLIAGYAMFTQSYGTWRLRHAVRWRAIVPYVVGGMFGAPLGAALLAYVSAPLVRTGIGLLLILYAAWGLTWGLARPRLRPIAAGTAADVGIGFVNGVLGGLTGLIGIVVSIWCQVRGFGKDVLRGVLQPVMLSAAVMSVASLAVAGTVTTATIKLFLLGAPAVFAGLCTGFWLYGRLDEAAFRKLVLVLLLASGVVLIVPLS
jgi:uncharacterized membrane protein YfcA